MDPLLLDAAVGFAAGGTGQMVSNVFKLGQSLVKGLSAAASASREEDRKDNDQLIKAAGRFPGWLTGTVAIIIVVAGFGGIFITAYNEMPTSLVEAKEPWLNLFGFIKFGGGWVVHTVEGLAIPDYFSRGVIVTVSAIMGIKAFK